MRYKTGRCLVRQHRIARKFTQEHLSELTGISVSHISKLENNRYVMSYEDGKTISAALGCSMEHLYEWKAMR